jgi:hypothetical protein
MLPNGSIGTDMEPKDIRVKLNGILKAIAAGRSCEQILAADQRLSYHDIFHAVAEAPTSYWERVRAQDGDTGLVQRLAAPRTPASQRTD